MIDEIIEFVKQAGKLKKTMRQGWIDELGIKRPESVADHTFRTAIMAMLVADLKNLNAEKMMKLALLHDIEETVTGDLTQKQKAKFSTEKLKEIKNGAIKEVISKLPAKLQNKYLDIIQEFNEKASEEAKLVSELDKLELVFQAFEYEKEGKGNVLNTQQFWDFVNPRVKDPELRQMIDKLMNERVKLKH